MKNQKITILGAGNMATALAYHLAKMGHHIRLYCIEPAIIKQINTKHINHKYLPGISLPDSIHATSRIADCVQDAHLVIVAIPSFAVAQALTMAKPYLRKDAIIAFTTKGLDPQTLKPMPVQMARVLSRGWGKKVCMLGGPAVATEMVKGTPMALVVACHDLKTGREVAKSLTGRNVKAAVSTDLLGVSLAGALKNAYAIGLGFCDGLKYDTNAKAFVVTMAVSEMAGIMLKAGAHPKTAPSLAGLGDLLVTGLSPHGRNRQYGERLVRAKTSDPKRLGLNTVEGITAADAGIRLAKRLGAKAPLLIAIQKGIHAKRNFHRPFVDYIKNLKLELI